MPGRAGGVRLVSAIADLRGASIALEDRELGLGVVVGFPLMTD